MSTDPAQVRMDAIAEDRRDALIRGALAADGYPEPIPMVGQVWHDTTATWLPDGVRRLVLLTSIGNTVSGWQCRVKASNETPPGADPSWSGSGFLYLDTLVRDYRLVEEG